MQTGNSRHGLKNTLQMLLLGLFISCFKQLYFGLPPSQVLSAGITARCTGTICSAPCLAAQEAGAGQFGKANAHLKASQPGGSTARARVSAWKQSKAPLAAGRGVSWWLPCATASLGARGKGPAPDQGCSCSGEGRDGRAASLQLEQGVANTHWGGQLSCGNAASVRAGLCGDTAAVTAIRAVGAGCWEVLGSTRQPCCGEGLGDSHRQAQHGSHQLMVVIYGLAVKHLTSSLWSELLQILCDPPPSRGSRT